MEPKTVGPRDGRPTTLYETRFDYELAVAYGLTILDDWSDELQERYGIKL